MDRRCRAGLLGRRGGGCPRPASPRGHDGRPGSGAGERLCDEASTGESAASVQGGSKLLGLGGEGGQRYAPAPDRRTVASAAASALMITRARPRARPETSAAWKEVSPEGTSVARRVASMGQAKRPAGPRSRSSLRAPSGGRRGPSEGRLNTSERAGGGVRQGRADAVVERGGGGQVGPSEAS